MTTTSLSHPDLMIAIPAIRRNAAQRWIVHLWRGEPFKAHFRHYEMGKIDVDHTAEWVAGGWAGVLPVAIPPRLKARAHRELLRLSRHHEQPLAAKPNHYHN
jgi:hypothetical protein